MATHIALLRAVNVGGTGKLPMVELRALAEALGFARPRTHIASGNLVFESPLGPAAVRAALEGALAAAMGKPVGVVLRSPAQLQALLDANPFPQAAPNRVAVTLLNEALDPDWAAGVRHQADEALAPAAPALRAFFVHYGAGMGQSRLRIPALDAGTARNLNTLRAVLALAA